MKAFKRHLLAIPLLLSPFILTAGQCDIAAPPQELKVGSVTADLPGRSFISATGYAKQLSGGMITVHAVQDQTVGNEDEITLYFPSQVLLPYTLALPGKDTSTVVYYCEMSPNQSCKSYFARQGQGSCYVTITKLTPTVEGTFTATAIQRGVSDSIRTLTSGAFKVAYQ